ncbi:MAG: ribosome small subunit-dependent GTPase A [Candidatus Hydrogenedentota bacterium]
MAKKRKKKRKLVRERDWETQGEFAFSHDRVKHRRAVPKVSDNAPRPPLPTEFTPNACVVSHSKKWAFVEIDGQELLCKIDERLEEETATLLAPGDQVLVAWEGGEAFVRGVAARRSKLSRKAPEHSRLEEQVFAANVDLLVVVASVADPPLRPGLIDRYLIASYGCHVEPILCINKMDVAPAEPPEAAIYRDLGIRVFTTSCATGAGIGALRDALRGKVSVLSGHSGVGKSSLINALDPNARLLTREVSQATGKGKHTTTAARMYELEGGIRIIDTAGIRALGLWGVSPAEVATYFPDLGEYAAACKFNDCTHTHEPGCAVREAIEAGQLSRARYESYLRIRASLEAERG